MLRSDNYHGAQVSLVILVIFYGASDSFYGKLMIALSICFLLLLLMMFCSLG